jgi:hypothetical protein
MLLLEMLGWSSYSVLATTQRDVESTKIGIILHAFEFALFVYFDSRPDRNPLIRNWPTLDGRKNGHVQIDCKRKYTVGRIEGCIR